MKKDNQQLLGPADDRILHLEFLKNLVDAGAVIFESISGGKDSDCLHLVLKDIVPPDQLVVVHADLGEVEWRGVQDHIRSTISGQLHVVRAGKTFFDMVRHRAKTRPDVPPWPSPRTRQCTSDLKRGPIQKFIRHEMRRRGATLAVNCTGIRAEESSARAKQSTLSCNRTLSKAGRTVYDLKPIHHWSTEEVFSAIKNAGQKPFWAYEENRRLSCVFCIMGCKGDLRHGAQVRPGLLAKYRALEEETGWTMFNGQSLAERIGLTSSDQRT